MNKYIDSFKNYVNEYLFGKPPEKMNEISKEFIIKYKSAKKIDQNYNHPLDPSGRSKVKKTYFLFNNGDVIEIMCTDIEENLRLKNNLIYLSNVGALLTFYEEIPNYRDDFTMEYNQSTMQSFYYIKDIPMAEEGDWIIAYNGNVVVGTRQWNGYMTDIPVMGNDNDEYSAGYMDIDGTPEFKLYKTETGELIDLYSEDYIPGFANNSTPVLSRLNNTTMSVPNSVVLHGAYPNPFNPVTNIKFTVESDQVFVELNIIDIQGRLVDKLVRNSYAFGEHEIMFNANLLSSGIYFVQLITEKDIKYSKIVLLK